jgi:hypothetical protein
VSYFIKRFRMNGPATVVKTDLTLEEAQEHCDREDTHGAFWFDGYTSTDNDNPDAYKREAEASAD